MGLEIERKFLVHKKLWDKEIPAESRIIRQGYLLSEAGKSVRVRVLGEQAYLTIKGGRQSLSRLEFEYEIPGEDAIQLLDHFTSRRIDKVRHYVRYQGKLWEVDEFMGDNAGLMVAEIELQSEDEVFDRPVWVAEEVTEDSRYLNVSLAEKPYCRW